MIQRLGAETPTSLGRQANSLNAFQRLMIHWSDLHPYNVVSLVELDGSFRCDQLAAAANGVLEEWGIAGLLHPESRGEFVYCPGPADVEVDEIVDTPTGVLTEFTSRELNRPFPRRDRFPIRMAGFTRGNRQFVAFSFDHWIMDGNAGVSLLLTILRRYLGLPPSSQEPMRGRRLPALGELVPATRSWIGQARNFCRTIDALWRLRTCHSPCRLARGDLQVATMLPNVPEDLLDRLAAASRQRKATINELVLTAFIESIAQATPERASQSRRRDLAVASIVDLRPLALDQLQTVAGLYLGYFQVFARDRGGATFDSLLATIRSQSMRIKRERSYLRSLSEIAYLNWIWGSLSDSEKIRHSMNNHPVAGGVSNLRVPDAWFDRGLKEVLHGGIRQLVPTSMMTPMAVAVTGSAGRLTLTATRRLACYPPEQASAIIDRLVDRLSTL